MTSSSDGTIDLMPTRAVVNGMLDGFELELAVKVQQLLLPKSSPLCTWCCIGVQNRMAAGLGGDYFDFITMPDGCQAIFVGDVTGHGLHASVVMSLIYGFLHRAAMGGCDPYELVQQVNQFLIEFSLRSENFDEYFSSTLFFGIIDPAALTINYVNAGHVPALVHRNGATIELNSAGTPIGFFETPEMHLQSFAFAKGDRLLLYTDGIIEAANSSGELFGIDRLKGLLMTHADVDFQEFLSIIFKSLADFGTSDPPADDCSAIVIDFHGMGGSLQGTGNQSL